MQAHTCLLLALLSGSPLVQRKWRSQICAQWRESSLKTPSSRLLNPAPALSSHPRRHCSHSQTWWHAFFREDQRNAQDVKLTRRLALVMSSKPPLQTYLTKISNLQREIERANSSTRVDKVQELKEAEATYTKAYQKQLIETCVQGLSSEQTGGESCQKHLDVFSQTGLPIDRSCYNAALRACWVADDPSEQGLWAQLFFEAAVNDDVADASTASLALRACLRASDWSSSMHILDTIDFLEVSIPAKELELSLLYLSVPLNSNGDNMASRVASHMSYMMHRQESWNATRRSTFRKSGDLDIAVLGVPPVESLIPTITDFFQQTVEKQLRAGAADSIVIGNVCFWIFEPQQYLASLHKDAEEEVHDTESEKENDLLSWSSSPHAVPWHGETHSDLVLRLADALHLNLGEQFGTCSRSGIYVELTARAPKKLADKIGLNQQSTQLSLCVKSETMRDWVRRRCLKIWSGEYQSMMAEEEEEKKARNKEKKRLAEEAVQQRKDEAYKLKIAAKKNAQLGNRTVNNPVFDISLKAACLAGPRSKADANPCIVHQAKGESLVSILPGIGPKRFDALKEEGLHTLAMLANIADGEVEAVAKKCKLPPKSLRQWISMVNEAQL